MPLPKIVDGTVKWFDPNRRYGFLRGDDGHDYFLHAKALDSVGVPQEGDRVAFEPRPGREGASPYAASVRLIERAAGR